MGIHVVDIHHVDVETHLSRRTSVGGMHNNFEGDVWSPNRCLHLESMSDNPQSSSIPTYHMHITTNDCVIAIKDVTLGGRIMTKCSIIRVTLERRNMTHHS
jgi:hypothetical protein